MLYGCVCPAAHEDALRRQRRARKLRASGRPLRVPIVGTRRRIQALMAIGYPRATIAESIGWTGGSLGALTDERRTYVDRATYLTVLRVYGELADTPGPSEKSRGWARRLGYLPPLAWDDDHIDDPAYDPTAIGDLAPPVSLASRYLPLDIVVRDGLGHRGSGAGNPRPPEARAAAVAILSARARDGLTDGDLAERAGITARTIQRILADARSA
jgi:hypothetical protein